MTGRVRAGIAGYIAFLLLVAVSAVLLREQAEDAGGAITVDSVDIEGLCAFLADDTVADQFRPEAERVQVLRSLLPGLEEQESAAPDALAADLRTIRQGAQRAADAERLEPMMTSEIATALGRLRDRCDPGG